ncbi:MAG: glutathione S-transferase family protein [Pseudomonadota bacterium]
MQIYYFFFSTPSLACLMTAEAAGIDFEKKLIDLREGRQNTPDFKAINPMSKVPAMIDGDLVLTESIAILLYLARKSETGLYPSQLSEQATVDRWLNLVVHEVRTPVLDIEVYRWVAQTTGNPVNNGVVEVALSRVNRALPILNDRLDKAEFLNGKRLTIADISLVSALDPVDTVGVDISPYPNVRAYLDRGRQQPWYKAVNAHFGAEVGLDQSRYR